MCLVGLVGLVGLGFLRFRSKKSGNRDKNFNREMFTFSLGKTVQTTADFLEEKFSGSFDPEK